MIVSGENLQFSYIVIYFVYGLSFFCMGLSMALEAGRSPLLADARVLRPLAAFGILHGIHEWLEIFSLLQKSMLGFNPPPSVEIFRLGLLALSFVSLAAFGLQIFRPPKRLAALDAYAGGFMIIFFLAILVVTGNTPMADPEGWPKNADAISRYALAIPSAILAALALRHHARNKKKKGGRGDKIAASLKVASACFFGYGFAQVFVNRTDFFPANLINSALFLELTGAPPQLLRAILALVATFALFRASQLVDQERREELLTAKQERLDALEKAQEELLKRKQLGKKFLRNIVLAQEEERSRISRELHDETAQILTAASLNMSTLESLLEDKPEAMDLLTRSKELCMEMSGALRRLVHDLRPAQLDDLGLVSALRHLSDHNHYSHGFSVSFEVFGRVRRLDRIAETVLFRLAQESLVNVFRHAQIDRARMELSFEEDETILTITDKGVGFVPELVSRECLGLAGMHERVEMIDGRLEIDTKPGQGTEIRVAVPLSSHGISRITVTKGGRHGKNHPGSGGG